MTALITSIMIMLGFVHSSAPEVQQATATPPPAPAITTFHSDSLKLDYTYPATFKSMREETDAAMKAEKDKATGDDKQSMNCVAVPITALDTTDGFHMVFLMTLDETCLGEETEPGELGEATSAVLSQTLQQFGEPKLNASADYELATHSASVVSGTVAADKLAAGKVFYATGTCSLIGKNIACWQFLSDTCEQLAVLSANTVKFEGQPAQPVIPAKLAPACK